MHTSSSYDYILTAHGPKERMNLGGGEGVVGDIGGVVVFPFVIEVNKHAAVTK